MSEVRQHDEIVNRSSNILKLYKSVDEVREEYKKTGRPLVVFEEYVYDLDEFINVVGHPGGSSEIEERLGCDITEDMILQGHSTSAYRMMRKYRVGRLGQSEAIEKPFEYHGPVKNVTKELLDSLNRKIDLHKPIFYQILTSNMTLEEYLTFIHDPKLLNDPPRDVRIFKSDFFEFFSRTPWYAIPLLWLPFILMILRNHYLRTAWATPLKVSGLLVQGFFIWTLTEYLIHRFVFHFDKRLPTNGLMFALHFLSHGIHHAFPQDRYRLVFPIILGVPTATLIILIICLIFGFGMGIFIGMGFGFGYVTYDLCHYYLHHCSGHGSYLIDLKEYHMKHHYKDFEAGYGVSSKLWDIIFNTVLKV